ncbi:hypothetical protein C8F04DRAFT_1188938 [Mycena alexandri]|uniref:Uncharacterized protein n=1 Tax=Mycena alexandri TaxID=1745969 RepID=A0AAD6WUS8_9AGAR|nr:hypothetical protein C8F04DRAFT_1188938 [Mycena alexandri]
MKHPSCMRWGRELKTVPRIARTSGYLIEERRVEVHQIDRDIGQMGERKDEMEGLEEARVFVEQGRQLKCASCTPEPSPPLIPKFWGVVERLRYTDNFSKVDCEGVREVKGQLEFAQFICIEERNPTSVLGLPLRQKAVTNLEAVESLETCESSKGPWKKASNKVYDWSLAKNLEALDANGVTLQTRTDGAISSEIQNLIRSAALQVFTRRGVGRRTPVLVRVMFVRASFGA